MNSVASPMYAGDFLSRNAAASGERAYLRSVLVRKPMMVRKSQRMRMPRSAAPQRCAISAGVVLPSPIAVKTSNSIADFKASVRWYALIVWNKRAGLGCCICGLDISSPLKLVTNYGNVVFALQSSIACIRSVTNGRHHSVLNLVFQSAHTIMVVSGAGIIRVPFISFNVTNTQALERDFLVQLDADVDNSIARHAPVSPIRGQSHLARFAGIHHVHASFLEVVKIQRTIAANDRFAQQLSHVSTCRMQRHNASPGPTQADASESKHSKRREQQTKFVGTNHRLVDLHRS